MGTRTWSGSSRPIPGFAQVYLQVVGLPLDNTPRALFAFRVPDAAMPDLVQLLTELLWMDAAPTNEDS